MNFSNIPIFNVMKAKMGYVSARQAVLAQNIANADTPDYRAKDIKNPDFKKLVVGAPQSIGMAVTNSKHLSGGNMGGMSFNTILRDSTYELNPNGNNVVIEEEMMRAAENQAEYQKVLSLYRKTVDMFKTAVGKPSGGA